MSTTNPRSPAVGAVPAGGRLAGVREQPLDPRRRRSGARGWTRLISPLVLLVIWQLVSVAGLISKSKLPPPTAVVSEAVTLIRTNSAAYGTLQHALLASLERFAFYARANACYAVVATGERRLYGNIILKKGIVRPG